MTIVQGSHHLLMLALEQVQVNLELFLVVLLMPSQITGKCCHKLDEHTNIYCTIVLHLNLHG